MNEAVSYTHLDVYKRQDKYNVAGNSEQLTCTNTVHAVMNIWFQDKTSWVNISKKETVWPKSRGPILIVTCFVKLCQWENKKIYH